MITPEQVLAARSPDKIVGRCAQGSLFVVFVHASVLKRVQELSEVGGGAPTWNMIGLEVAGNIPLATTTPEWFMELGEQIRLSRGAL